MRGPMSFWTPEPDTTDADHRRWNAMMSARSREAERDFMDAGFHHFIWMADRKYVDDLFEIYAWLNQRPWLRAWNPFNDLVLIGFDNRSDLLMFKLMWGGE
jgi:hypothetical protein